jgi:hypothetical protein
MTHPIPSTNTRRVKRLGRHQLCLLATMGSPFSLLVIRDKVSQSIESRGLLAPSRKDGLFGITPQGLRTLADALERGELEPFFDGRFRERDMTRLYINGKADAS